MKMDDEKYTIKIKNRSLFRMIIDYIAVGSSFRQIDIDFFRNIDENRL